MYIAKFTLHIFILKQKFSRKNLYFFEKSQKKFGETKKKQKMKCSEAYKQGVCKQKNKKAKKMKKSVDKSQCFGYNITCVVSYKLSDTQLHR